MEPKNTDSGDLYVAESQGPKPAERVVNGALADDAFSRPFDNARQDLQAALEELRVGREELARQRAEIVTKARDAEQARRRYEDLFRTAPDGYVVTDKNGIVREANDAAAELMGCRKDHLPGKPIFVFLPLADRSQLRHALLKLQTPGASMTLPLNVRRQNGAHAMDLEARVGASPVVQNEVELRWVLRDLSERRRAEASEQESQRLQAENTAKDEFISFLTHELRTPLTIIIGNTEALVRHTDLDESTRNESLEEIRKESKRIHHVVENLLFLAVTNQSRQFEPEYVMLQRLLPSLIDDHRRQHPNREIVCRIDKELPPVHADRVYCEQIVQNLLSNAEKYGAAGAPIELEANQVGNDARVLVLDRGRGIQKAEAKRLFNLFERGRDVLETSGSGIGLAVCKRLVEMQGGSIWAKPRSGGGSEFGFTLPLAGDDTGD